MSNVWLLKHFQFHGRRSLPEETNLQNVIIHFHFPQCYKCNYSKTFTFTDVKNLTIQTLSILPMKKSDFSKTFTKVKNVNIKKLSPSPKSKMWLFKHFHFDESHCLPNNTLIERTLSSGHLFNIVSGCVVFNFDI